MSLRTQEQLMRAHLVQLNKGNVFGGRAWCGTFDFDF